MNAPAARIALAVVAALLPALAGCSSPTAPGTIWCDHFDPEAEVGFWVEDRVAYLDVNFTNRWALVGKGEGFVQIEYRGMRSGNRDWGLVVDPKTGAVMAALDFTEPGEPETLAVGPHVGLPPKEEPTAVADETITVPAGEYAAVRRAFGEGDRASLQWLGTEGLVEGIVLRASIPDGPTVELASIEPETLTIGEQSVEVAKAKWTNGREDWITKEEMPFVGDRMKVAAGTLATEVTGFGTDAKPAPGWPPVERAKDAPPADDGE